MSTVIVFPGQGCQKQGMAQDFVAAHPESRAVFEEASDALGLDLQALCTQDDPRLHLTEFTQPAILTAEIAMLRALQAEHGLGAERWAGHSLGEYTALVAAGALDLASAVRVVRERGRRMQSAVPAGVGAMAAIIQPELEISAVRACLNQADIANHNAPNQVVISGASAEVQAATERYRSTEQGSRAKIRMLKVSAPFHSRLMAPIEADFRTLLAEQTWEPMASTAVLSNITGQPYSGTLKGLLDGLTAQISGTVRWVDCMSTIIEDASGIIEIGPGRPLRGFFRGMLSLGETPLHAITNCVSARRALAD